MGDGAHVRLCQAGQMGIKAYLSQASTKKFLFSNLQDRHWPQESVSEGYCANEMNWRCKEV
jgi:hypothetical protein